MAKTRVFLYENPDRVWYEPALLADLYERFPSAEFSYFDSREEMRPHLAEAEVLGGEIYADELPLAKNLRWFHTWTNGADIFLYPEMLASDVILTSSRGNGGIPLAEHAIMHMLMLNRNAMRWARAQEDHRWDRFVHGELNGKTCGIIGLGVSGIDLAEKAKAFHMHVLGMRRRPIDAPFVDEIFTRDNLGELIARSDFLVITAPITPETRGMIDERLLRMMKPSAHVICFSHGGIIDDDALLRALYEGWIAGAGLDAHDIEPLPPESPFWDAPNTLITPHIGAVTREMWGRGAETFEINLERYLAGEPLRESDIVDKAAGY